MSDLKVSGVKLEDIYLIDWRLESLARKVGGIIDGVNITSGYCI